MDDSGNFVLGLVIIIAIIFLIIWFEWIIGKLIGRNVSQLTGIILGIVLIIFGFSFLTGIACIVYSQKNKNAPIDVNANIIKQSDEIECPYCAETIKKNAKICRYCKNEI